MPYKNGKLAWNEKVWTRKEEDWIREKFWLFTNVEMAKILKVGITAFRMKIAEMGLKKIEMEYWNKKQTKFLLDNYKSIGDTELAEIFEKRWPKKKTWTSKHIRKKRLYLNLHRTEDDLVAIMQRNVDAGRMSWHVKGQCRWLTTGPAKQGEIRMYKSCQGVTSPRIKIGKRWMWWQRWIWLKTYGPIPEGMVVVFKDHNSFNTKISNLELVTRSEATRRNAAQSAKDLTDNYVAAQLGGHDKALTEAIKSNPDLIETHRVLLLLKRKIKNHHAKQRSATAA